MLSDRNQSEKSIHCLIPVLGHCYHRRRHHRVAAPHHVQKAPSHQGSEVTLTTRISEQAGQRSWAQCADGEAVLGSLLFLSHTAGNSITSFYPKAYTLVPSVQPPGPWWTLDTVVGGMGCVTTGLDVSLWTGVWKRGFWQVHSVALALSGPWTSSFLPQSLPISFSVAGIDIHSTQSAGSRCLLFIHWKHISCPSSICLEEAGQEVPINALYIPGLDSLVTEMPTCRKQKEDFFFFR